MKHKQEQLDTLRDYILANPIMTARHIAEHFNGIFSRDEVKLFRYRAGIKYNRGKLYEYMRNNTGSHDIGRGPDSNGWRERRIKSVPEDETLEWKWKKLSAEQIMVNKTDDPRHIELITFILQYQKDMSNAQIAERFHTTEKDILSFRKKYRILKRFVLPVAERD